jgi:hypothetical protein
MVIRSVCSAAHTQLADAGRHEHTNKNTFADTRQGLGTIELKGCTESHGTVAAE